MSKWADMTPEQKERRMLWQRQRHANMTPEERQRYLEKRRLYLANLSPERKMKLKEQRRRWNANKRAKQTPEQRHAYYERYSRKSRKNYAEIYIKKDLWLSAKNHHISLGKVCSDALREAIAKMDAEKGSE